MISETRRIERRVASRRMLVVAFIAALLFGAGCASPPPEPVNLLASSEEQMKLRNLQTRTLEIQDRRIAMRGVISALQDLGFIIERANEPLGLVTAARFAEPRYWDVIAVTVTVRPGQAGGTQVRVNAIYNNEPVSDPGVYRNFFTSLDRALFADRNQ